MRNFTQNAGKETGASYLQTVQNYGPNPENENTAVTSLPVLTLQSKKTLLSGATFCPLLRAALSLATPVAAVAAVGVVDQKYNGEYGTIQRMARFCSNDDILWV